MMGELCPTKRESAKGPVFMLCLWPEKVAYCTMTISCPSFLKQPRPRKISFFHRAGACSIKISLVTSQIPVALPRELQRLVTSGLWRHKQDLKHCRHRPSERKRRPEQTQLMPFMMPFLIGILISLLFFISENCVRTYIINMVVLK